MKARDGPELKIERLPEVLNRTGLTKKTLYRLMSTRRIDGDGYAFPNSRDLSPGTVGWNAEEVDEWIRNRPSTRRPGRHGN